MGVRGRVWQSLVLLEATPRHPVRSSPRRVGGVPVVPVAGESQREGLEQGRSLGGSVENGEEERRTEEKGGSQSGGAKSVRGGDIQCFGKGIGVQDERFLTLPVL